MTFMHFLAGKSSGILSDIFSDILFDILSGVSSGIFSGISFGILSGKSSGILPGIGEPQRGGGKAQKTSASSEEEVNVEPEPKAEARSALVPRRLFTPVPMSLQKAGVTSPRKRSASAALCCGRSKY